MTKEESLEEFLKGLKVVFSNASAYDQSHPYFVKSVETFKLRIEDLAMFANPIILKFAPELLFFDGAYLKKTPLHNELAEVFHARKIKGLEIRPGITVEELSYFFSKLCLLARDIIKSGGLQVILEPEKASHIAVEELDYSLLLREQGEESKDIWLCLFQGIIGRGDHQKIMGIAEQFEGLMRNFKAKDIVEEPRLKEDISKFLAYLMTHDTEKFRKCAKTLFKLILKDNHILERHSLDEIMEYFKGLDAESFSETLWEQIVSSSEFDSSSFELFSRLIDHDTHQKIAPMIVEKLKNSPIAAQNQKVSKRMKDLFTFSKDSHIASTYLEVLKFLSQESDFKKGFLFENDAVATNYHLILLNLFVQEDDPQRLKLVVDKILGVFDKIVQDKKFEYFSCLFEVVKQKKASRGKIADALEPLDKRIAQFIETMAFEEEIPPDFEFFIDALQQSSMEPQVYFDKIFSEKRINPYSLKLLLKLFPGELQHFYAELEKKYFDLDFLEEIVESLQWVHLPVTFGVLEYMFSFANNLIRIEIVRAMRRIERSDDAFLFDVLKSDDFSLKKEALRVLMWENKTKARALHSLFSVRNPWGKYNNLILRHLIIVEELELKDARSYVVAISKQWLFWHAKIRKKAQEILARWESGKD